MAGSLVVDCQMKIILEKYLQGLTKNYDALVSHLGKTDTTSSDLIRYLDGLRSCISMLTRDMDVLVGVVMKVDWSVREEAVVKEYQSYLLNLVSAHTYYLRSCLHMLVKHFYPRQRELSPEYLKDPTTAIDDVTRATHELSFSNVHIVIKNLCAIAPAATTTLFCLLEECFPHYTRCVFTQECYVRNLLTLTHYMGGDRLRILNLIISRMVQIDVRCPRSDIEETEDLEEDSMEDPLFHMENEQKCDEPHKCMKHKEANKLDVMMHLLLSYIHNVCHADGHLDWEATKKLYRELLYVFEKILLPTYASCHVQFVMFYLCSLREALCEGFLDFLWKYVQNPNTEAVHRQSAVSYIASLLARATYVSISTVKTMLQLMSTWLHTYLDQSCYSSQPDVWRHGPFYSVCMAVTVKTILQLMTTWLHTYLDQSCYSSQPDVWRHGPFYSVCQAVFYVIAFRHKEILETSKGYRWVKSLGLQTLVTARLNPLKVCLPVVTRTFSNIARTHQLAFCEAVIERNTRSVIPVARDSNAPLTHINKLDSFFPFDSYLLTRSSEYVSGIYREFEGLVYDEPPQDIVEEEDYLDDDQQPETSSIPFDSTIDFMDYGTSPGFKHS